MSTVSEQYFLDYCRARRYKVKRITPKDKAGRFPDYETTTPAGSVIVEIKEFTPNDEDHALTIVLSEGVFARQSLIQHHSFAVIKILHCQKFSCYMTTWLVVLMAALSITSIP